MMRNRWSPLWITLGVIGIYAAMTMYYYPLLPARLATHFGPTGTPDGWMSKAAFVQSFSVFLLYLMAMTAGLGTLLGRIPKELVNLPNKDYWFAPERKAITLAYFRGYMNRLALAVGALMLALVQSTYRANLRTPPALGAELWPLLALFLIYMAISTVGLVRRFGRAG